MNLIPTIIYFYKGILKVLRMITFVPIKTIYKNNKHIWIDLCQNNNLNSKLSQKNNPAPNDPNWATVKVGTLWIKGEELTTPASVINALNDNGVLFTDGTNKMLGNININRI